MTLLLVLLAVGAVLSVVHGVQTTMEPEPAPDEPDTRGTGTAVALVILALVGGFLLANMLIGLSVAAGIR